MVRATFVLRAANVCHWREQTLGGSVSNGSNQSLPVPVDSPAESSELNDFAMGSAMETIEHKRHRITFEVADRGKGWTWTFQIDSGPVIANAGAPSPK